MYTRSEVFVNGYIVIDIYDVPELTMVAVVVAVVKPVFVAVIVALGMQIKYQVAQIRKLVATMLNLMQLRMLPDVE